MGLKKSGTGLLTLLACLTMGTGTSGCASNPPAQKSNLSFGGVKRSVVKGKTTQAEVVQLFGSPNIVTKNSKGNEIWTYARQSYDAETGAFGWGAIFVGGNKAFSTGASSSFDLILTFDKDDVVSDYSVVSSQF